MSSSNVPQSITFGKKILSIPSLEEMGIPKEISGLGMVTLESNLYEKRYEGGHWVERGDSLLSYRFNAFTKEKLSFFEKLSGNDPSISETWNIVSPVSGLVVNCRDEQTSEVNPSVNLLYHNVSHPLLPVILIPNDEPLPKEDNFYTYDSISSWLSNYYYLLFIRNRDWSSAGRLGKHLESSDWAKENYPKFLDEIRNREQKNHRSYNIREISKRDSKIIYNTQNMRGKYIDLRDKLLHISREFGESI